jgi:sugar-specific transcriptional regulator TrmB
MILEKVLEKFGLSDKEAKMYLASLELGYAPMQDIAKKATINRTTGYVILESLVSKGLMTSFTKGKKRFFAAEPPDQVANVLEKQKEEIEAKKKELEILLPELKGLYNLSETKPHVKFYEGKEGLKAIEEDLLRGEGKESLKFISIDDLFAAFPNYEQEYSNRRVGRKVKIRVIYTSSHGPRPEVSAPTTLREARFVPKEKFPFSCAIGVFGDKTSLISYKGNLFGVLIENKYIADSMTAAFELAWEGAEKYQTK